MYFFQQDFTVFQASNDGILEVLDLDENVHVQAKHIVRDKAFWAPILYCRFLLSHFVLDEIDFYDEDDKKVALSQWYAVLYYLLLYRYHLFLFLETRALAQDCDNDIGQCREILRRLEPLKRKHAQSIFKPSPFVERMNLWYILSRGVGYISMLITRFNADVRYMYGYWMRGMLSSLVSLMPDDFCYVSSAQYVLNIANIIIGYFSCILYYLRFVITLFRLAHEVYMGNSYATWKERLQYGWSIYKDSIITDFAWGTSNLLSIFWLVGVGILGCIGNICNVVLYMMDGVFHGIHYRKMRKEYIGYAERWYEGYQKLHHNYIQLPTREHILVLYHHIYEALYYSMYWQHERATLRQNIIYSLGLVLVFILSCVSLSSLFLLCLIGSILCFVWTAIHNSILEYRSFCWDRDQNIARYTAFLYLYPMMQDEQHQYLIFSDMLREYRYEQERMIYRRYQLCANIFTHVMIPLSAFVCFVFMPIWASIPVFILIALGCALLDRHIKNMQARHEKTVSEGRKESLPPYNADDVQFQSFKTPAHRKHIFSFWHGERPLELESDKAVLLLEPSLI